MNKNETAQIIAVLQVAYPDYFKSMSDNAMKGLINLWDELLGDYTYAEVNAAVKAHIATSTDRFFPPIGVIISKIQELRGSGQAITEMDAWRLVSKAVRNSGYNSVEEFEKLPPTVRATVGSPQMLCNWAMLPEDELETVVQSNFMRSYREKARSEKNYQALPASIKTLVGKERKMLEG